ncbi:SDR family NAD(P)-dependent oxidoreductase [Glycomyces sp. NPDC048151]|uniref:SDR family NAD(P)-dependent oxidoreductase n=1 Tax=Glycomyces sp. NPDC048151 TaxID=3364002 RepID=UPI0037114A15
MTIPDVSAKSLHELVSLAGRRAVVTGGGRGLGKAIALRLAEAGADILIGDIDGTLAERAAAEIAERHDATAVGTAMDVADAASVAAAGELAAARLGGIDIWVNNAGVFPSVPVAEMSVEAWDQVFAVNARGVFLGAKEAAARMDGGGVIVNVVSTAGFKGTAPGLAAYVGSKHAARGLTKQLALEFAPKGIRVLGVAPSFVPTEGNMAAATAAAEAMGVQLDPAQIAANMGTGLLGRIGVPDDIARVVLFCASDLSALMTGSTLLADAGDTI